MPVNDSSIVYNTIIFFILIVSMLIMIKPEFIYCNKTKKFKSFGCNKEGASLLCFPIVSATLAVVLYIFFLSINIMFDKLPTNNTLS